jgi:hypothetical protein
LEDCLALCDCWLELLHDRPCSVEFSLQKLDLRLSEFRWQVTLASD